MDAAVSDIFHNTPCPCTAQECAVNGAGYKVGIALVQKMHDDVHGLNEDVSGSAFALIK